MEAGLLTDLDRNALAMYCVAYGRHVESEQMLQGPAGYCPNCDPGVEHDETARRCEGVFHRRPEYGLVVRGKTGGWVKSPYQSIYKESEAQMVRLMGEFGLSPASRSRLPGGKANPGKPRPKRAPSMETPRDARTAWEAEVMAARN